MKKRALLTFFVLCFFLLIQNAQGQEETGIHMHGSVGLSLMSENRFGSGFWSGFGFSVPMRKDVFLDFNFGAWKSQVGGQPDGLRDGTLTVNPFFVSLQYVTGEGRRWMCPYFFIGGGYIFTHFRMEDINTIPEITLSQKVDSAPGGQAGVGIQVKVSKRIFLNADVSYLFSKTSGTTTIQDLNFETRAEDFSFLLSAFIFQCGIKLLI